MGQSHSIANISGVVLVAQVVSDFLQQLIISKPSRLLCPWDFQASILQWADISSSRNFPDPGVEPGPCIADRFFTGLSYQGSPFTRIPIAIVAQSE